MFDAIARLMPAAATFSRQIVPPVVATLIAAGLISGYNRAFSGHLSQPRMSALHADEPPFAASVTTVGMSKAPAAPGTDVITIYEETATAERLWEKDAKEEAGKDQTVTKVAADPAPAPARAVTQAPRPEPRRFASIEPVQPIAPVIVAVPPSVVSPPATASVVAPMPPAHEQRPSYQPQYRVPPRVTMGSPPVVTVPDRPNARPPEEAQVPLAPQGAMSKFVNALKPSTWFARAREFGDKIEQAGNDILPSIRQ
jgi:hypothetical protein